MTLQHDIRFHSSNERFAVTLAASALARVLDACRLAGMDETGGILVGRYTDGLNCAIVTAVSDVPGDSRSGPTWFYRGVLGLQRWLGQLWRNERQYYLGEWHFHPYAKPKPSPDDVEQMTVIAASPAYRCPEPVLLIVGGDPAGAWSMRAFVFLHGAARIEMRRQEIE